MGKHGRELCTTSPRFSPAGPVPPCRSSSSSPCPLDVLFSIPAHAPSRCWTAHADAWPAPTWRLVWLFSSPQRHPRWTVQQVKWCPSLTGDQVSLPSSALRRSFSRRVACRCRIDLVPFPPLIFTNPHLGRLGKSSAADPRAESNSRSALMLVVQPCRPVSIHYQFVVRGARKLEPQEKRLVAAVTARFSGLLVSQRAAAGGTHGHVVALNRGAECPAVGFWFHVEIRRPAFIPQRILRRAGPLSRQHHPPEKRRASPRIAIRSAVSLQEWPTRLRRPGAGVWFTHQLRRRLSSARHKASGSRRVVTADEENRVVEDMAWGAPEPCSARSFTEAGVVGAVSARAATDEFVSAHADRAKRRRSCFASGSIAPTFHRSLATRSDSDGRSASRAPTPAPGVALIPSKRSRRQVGARFRYAWGVLLLRTKGLRP